MSSYQYRRLELSRNEIRKIALQPGSGDSVVEVEIVHAFLDDNPTYEALSYVWGDPTVDSNFTADCGVYIFKATTNLESALRHLRFVDKPRYLWADAICINQNGLDERCQQVGIMGSIYAEASRVIIWLGHDEEHLGPELQQMVSGYDMLDSLSQSQTDAVAGLLKSAWFTRVWVIQEAALSQSPYVLWGETEISWRLLVFLLKKIGDQRIAVGDL
ncbi:heterokaryon incompatibility protein-domain-containing protein [Leptodontidium sp. MPI-SDFR-AT-0119]|nr:heterokaryon incompatibility protein-domain-containing protein [Leptodontidium sp. MPI-SDFR-AT-0119]